MYYLYIRDVILRALSRHSSIYRVFYNNKMMPQFCKIVGLVIKAVKSKYSLSS